MSRRRWPALVLCVALFAGACGGDDEPELVEPELTDTEPDATAVPTATPDDELPRTATAVDVDDEALRTGSAIDLIDLRLRTPLEPDDPRYGIVCTVVDVVATDTDATSLPDAFGEPDLWYLVDPVAGYQVGPRIEAEAPDAESTVELAIGLDPIGSDQAPPEVVSASVGMAAAIEAASTLGDEVYIGTDLDDVVLFGFSVSARGDVDLFRSCLSWEEDVDLIAEFLDESSAAVGVSTADAMLSLAGVCDCDGPALEDLVLFLDDV